MKRLRGCLTVVFIFGCGFLVGGFLGTAIGWMSFFNKVVKSGPVAVQTIVSERLKDDLKLKGEQRGEARKIVEETARELDAATQEVRPKVGEILSRAEDRIDALLKEDWQRQRLKRTLEQARRKWQPAGAADSSLPQTPNAGGVPPPPKSGTLE